MIERLSFGHVAAHVSCRAVILDVLQGLDSSNCLVLQVRAAAPCWGMLACAVLGRWHMPAGPRPDGEVCVCSWLVKCVLGQHKARSQRS
jgi:hypothetical protein